MFSTRALWPVSCFMLLYGNDKNRINTFIFLKGWFYHWFDSLFWRKEPGGDLKPCWGLKVTLPVWCFSGLKMLHRSIKLRMTFDVCLLSEIVFFLLHNLKFLFICIVVTIRIVYVVVFCLTWVSFKTYIFRFNYRLITCRCVYICMIYRQCSDIVESVTVKA